MTEAGLSTLESRPWQTLLFSSGAPGRFSGPVRGAREAGRPQTAAQSATGNRPAAFQGLDRPLAVGSGAERLRDSGRGCLDRGTAGIRTPRPPPSLRRRSGKGQDPRLAPPPEMQHSGPHPLSAPLLRELPPAASSWAPFCPHFKSPEFFNAPFSSPCPHLTPPASEWFPLLITVPPPTAS